MPRVYPALRADLGRLTKVCEWKTRGGDCCSGFFHRIGFTDTSAVQYGRLFKPSANLMQIRNLSLLKKVQMREAKPHTDGYSSRQQTSCKHASSACSKRFRCAKPSRTWAAIQAVGKPHANTQPQLAQKVSDARSQAAHGRERTRMYVTARCGTGDKADGPFSVS